MGEAGLEIIARNSHSLGVVTSSVGATSIEGDKPKNYLVVYGGASSEYGPLGDTVYSELPDAAEIGNNKLLYI